MEWRTDGMMWLGRPAGRRAIQPPDGAPRVIGGETVGVAMKTRLGLPALQVRRTFVCCHGSAAPTEVVRLQIMTASGP